MINLGLISHGKWPHGATHQHETGGEHAVLDSKEFRGFFVGVHTIQSKITMKTAKPKVRHNLRCRQNQLCFWTRWSWSTGFMEKCHTQPGPHKENESDFSCQIWKIMCCSCFSKWINHAWKAECRHKRVIETSDALRGWDESRQPKRLPDWYSTWILCWLIVLNSSDI